MGHAGLNGAQGFGQGGGDAGIHDIFESVFGDIFGGGRGRGGPQRNQGSDLQYELELSLEEVAAGVQKTLEIPKQARCDDCGGSGAKKGSQPVTCSACNGQGQVRMQHGVFSVQQTCRQCGGKGKVISDPCTSCRGQGRVRKVRNLSVNIPAGVDNGNNIRLAGEGEAGANQGAPGDLYLLIRVRPHPLFQREGHDLHCEVPVKFTTAALGGELEVPTLDGQVMLKVPAETQTGQQFRIKGKGIPSVQDSYKGNLYCHVTVETPVHLNRKQKEMLLQFEESMEQNSSRHSPKTSSWLDSVKSFFEKTLNKSS